MKPIFALFLIAMALSAGAANCKEMGFGECYSVHARYNIYADGDALWPVGTKRLLDTTDDKLDQMLEQAGWEEHSIFGDFVVCPESKYMPGHKQEACIQSYKNIRLAQWKRQLRRKSSAEQEKALPAQGRSLNQ